MKGWKESQLSIRGDSKVLVENLMGCGRVVDLGGGGGGGQ